MGYRDGSLALLITTIVAEAKWVFILTLSRSQRCGGKHTHTGTGLRVSHNLHMLIRGLLVVCYHHAGFRRQHGLGSAQPYRGTELSLLVWWATARAFLGHQVAILL